MRSVMMGCVGQVTAIKDSHLKDSNFLSDILVSHI